MSDAEPGYYLFKLSLELGEQIRKDLKTRLPCVTIQDWITEAIYLRLVEMDMDELD